MPASALIHPDHAFARLGHGDREEIGVRRVQRNKQHRGLYRPASPAEFHVAGKMLNSGT